MNQQAQSTSTIPVQIPYQPYPGVIRNTSFLSRQALGLGGAQIVIGALCIIFNITALGIQEIFSLAAHGIWGGILFIIAGSLGVGAAKNNSKCLINSFNVMCIISASICTVVLSLGIPGAVIAGLLGYYLDSVNNNNNNNNNNYNYNYDYYYHIYGCYNYRFNGNNNSLRSCIQGQVAMEALLAILAFVEAICAIRGSVICCRAHCCCRCCRAENPMQLQGVNPGTPMQIVIQQQPQQHQQYYPQNYPPQNYHNQYNPNQNYPNPNFAVAPPQNYNPQGYPGYGVPPQGQAMPGYSVAPPQGPVVAQPAYSNAPMPNTSIGNASQDAGSDNQAYEHLRK